MHALIDLLSEIIGVQGSFSKKKNAQVKLFWLGHVPQPFAVHGSCVFELHTFVSWNLPGLSNKLKSAQVRLFWLGNSWFMCLVGVFWLGHVPQPFAVHGSCVFELHTFISWNLPGLSKELKSAQVRLFWLGNSWFMCLVGLFWLGHVPQPFAAHGSCVFEDCINEAGLLETTSHSEFGRFVSQSGVWGV